MAHILHNNHGAAAFLYIEKQKEQRIDMDRILSEVTGLGSCE
jgi:hypothetical protein